MMSFLRWAGSKRQLLPILTEIIGDDFERYVEPFAGSACVFFELLPGQALLGDINPELMHTYVEVKYRVEGVIKQLGKWRKSKKRYFELRAMDPKSLPAATRAARFIYLNRCCFNGLYRTNRNGQFNVPFGGKRSGRIPSAEVLREASNALKKARLVRGDFTNSLKKVKRGDFVYMDPPFSITSHRMFNEYDASVFATAQLEQLRHEMEKLARRNIKFLVSYADSAEARLLRRGFKSTSV
ncbi:MAG TPA: Dam family site-specific DNA-(adenine-N6)-methyltransferase, partial [Chthoniobacterales bacterium]|nr:Dam family site-specific DNA-(adenine-N6)-methyltransferase [Chthoniobacterales bacterium]